MTPRTTALLDGRIPYHAEEGDALEKLTDLPDGSVDLIMFSPPYERRRTYGIGFARKGDDFVDWLFAIVQQALRVSTGAVVVVLQGVTDKFKWSGTPVLLAADLLRAGCTLRTPCIYYRSGISGSGGPDYFRCNYEFCLVVTKGGRLPWHDNTACGHPPLWAPGGAMSHRMSDGTRRNQWGRAEKSGRERSENGERKSSKRPSHHFQPVGRRVVRGKKDGDTQTSDSYLPPAIANPGNVIEDSYTTTEVENFLVFAGAPRGDVIRAKVGGGHMGSKLAHKNEAPFAEELPRRFVLSMCRPGGIVCDPFCGSGTTLAVAHFHGRRALGFDIRGEWRPEYGDRKKYVDQVALTLNRLGGVTPCLFEAGQGKKPSLAKAARRAKGGA